VFGENRLAAKEGGKMARDAREQLGQKTGKDVVSKKDFLHLTGKKKKTSG